MKKSIKRMLAITLALGTCIAGIPVTNANAESVADRVLTNEDIPDEALYNAMLEAGDADWNGELTLSEAEIISYLSIPVLTDELKGLELIERVQVNILEDYSEEVDSEELKILTEKLVDYDNIYALNVNEYISEEVYEDITKMSLEYVDLYCEEGFDFSVISKAELLDNQLYETVNDVRIAYPHTTENIFSMDYLKCFSKLDLVQIQGTLNITDIDKIKELSGLRSLYIIGKFPEDAIIDVSNNAYLDYLVICENTYENKPIVKIGNNEIPTIQLDSVVFSEEPVSSSHLSLNYCDLSDMSMDFSAYENIETLQITNSNISSVTGLDKCEKLNNLNLSSNNLSVVPKISSNFNAKCGLNLGGNAFTREDILKNIPECFTSDEHWLLQALSKTIELPDNTYYDVYTEFNTDFFVTCLAPFEDFMPVQMIFNTCCSKFTIERSILEWAAEREEGASLEFTYVDELGNIATAVVDLKEAYNTLSGDCIVDFGYGSNAEMKDTWNTDKVYSNLHDRYLGFGTCVDGVTYYNKSENVFNIYTGVDERYKYGIGIMDLHRMNFSDDETYYYILTESDPNWPVTSEKGKYSGMESTSGINDYIPSLSYEIVESLPNGATVHADIASEISMEMWSLMISKKLNLNLYMTDSNGLYIKGKITFDYEQMRECREDEICFIGGYVTEEGNIKQNFYTGDIINGDVNASVYVGDIAQNGETVCIVEDYTYISTDKCKANGYKVIKECVVDSGMIEFTRGSGMLKLINKNNVEEIKELSLPTGDIKSYSKGEKIKSLKNKEVDNIDLRGWKGGLTVSCDFEYDGEEENGTFFILSDRSRDIGEGLEIALTTNGVGLYLCAFQGYDTAQIQYVPEALSLVEGGRIDVAMFCIDGKYAMSLYYNDELVGTIRLSDAKGIVIEEDGTIKEVTDESEMMYAGTGIGDLEISDFNTLYCGESAVNDYHDYNYNVTELSVYAGNQYGEDEIFTESSDDNTENEDKDDNEGEDKDETGNEDEEETAENPEQIEEDKIIEPEKVVDVIISDMNNKDDKTVEVISSGSQVIDQKIFDEMVKSDKNITYGVTDEDNNLKYSWSFASKYITNTEIPVDLEIEVKKENNKVDKKLNNKNAVYVEFKHHGELPGPATVKVYVGDSYKVNKKVHIYYYDEAQDKILKVGNKPVTVLEGGYIEFTISHCSTYFVMEEEQADTLNKEQKIELDKDSYEDVNFDVIESSDSDVDAGDKNNRIKVVTLLMIEVCSVLVLGMILLSNRKRNRTE